MTHPEAQPMAAVFPSWRPLSPQSPDSRRPCPAAPGPDFPGSSLGLGSGVWLELGEAPLPGAFVPRELAPLDARFPLSHPPRGRRAGEGLVPEPAHEAEEGPGQRLGAALGGVRDRGHVQRAPAAGAGPPAVAARPASAPAALRHRRARLRAPRAQSAGPGHGRRRGLGRRRSRRRPGSCRRRIPAPASRGRRSGPGAHRARGLHAGAPAASHGLFSLPVPSLLGSVASRLSSAPLTMAGSLAGNLQELSARYLSSSAFEPYSRTNNKEGAEKKALD